MSNADISGSRILTNERSHVPTASDISASIIGPTEISLTLSFYNNTGVAPVYLSSDVTISHNLDVIGGTIPLF